MGRKLRGKEIKKEKRGGERKKRINRRERKKQKRGGGERKLKLIGDKQNSRQRES